MWNPCGMIWIPWWNIVESMWKVMDSIVESYGFHSGMLWNPCGMMWNPCGIIWNPCEKLWIP